VSKAIKESVCRSGHYSFLGGLYDLIDYALKIVFVVPLRIVALKFAHIANPPDVIA
jgi:hypothetical protein